MNILEVDEKKEMPIRKLSKIQTIDSHTCGEPTRIIIAGGPDLGSGTLTQRRDLFRQQFDHIRAAVVNEPRGSDTLVGALLCKPQNQKCIAGVIFFNNIGYLGMCGHGTIGLVKTLAYMDRIQPGTYLIETPVGQVSATLLSSGETTVSNVASYRYLKNVEIEVDNHGRITGDVAWGGNWFFLVEDHGQQLSLLNIKQLKEITRKIRNSLKYFGITGANDESIDHIELFGPPVSPNAHSRNFVLCPGGAYDRSPCGTGTSAKLACLFADGKLKPGQIWRQESIVNTVFEGSIQVKDNIVYPSIKGSAYITGENTLVLDPLDPFCNGITIATNSFTKNE